MLYSVWNQNAKRYDYYEASGSLRDGVFAPNAQLAGGHELGLAADEAARQLPADARQVGSGETAKGMIATRKKGFDIARIGFAAFIGYAILKGLKVF